MTHATGTIDTTDELGIDITKQQPGTVILIETEDDMVFEMKITRPEKAIVEVTATEPRLKYPVLGILSHAFSGDKKTQINHWVGMLLCVSLIFKNGNFETKPVVHASIRGPDNAWKFDVF